jgi:3',5'-cyclic AMP phosphodiesterase CpdA
MQMSDPQLGFGESSGFEEGAALLDKMVSAINERHPAFVIVTGDMTNSSKSGEQYRAYMERISKIAKDIPVYHLPGNHDVKINEEKSYVSYYEKYGPDRFSFLYEGCAFIGINSSIIIEGSQEAEEKQKAWLEKQLASYKDANQIFVFMHYPIVTKKLDEKETYSNFPKEKRGVYLELFHHYGVKAIFAGHLHQCFSCWLDSLEMVTCGPSGKPLGEGYPGYNWITISKEGYKYEYIPL